jgi:hypothetical protein
MTKRVYECEHDNEIRSFDSFAECKRFVLREGDQNRLWSYVGCAQAIYELGFEPTSAQVQEHFDVRTTREQLEEAYKLRNGSGNGVVRFYRTLDEADLA